jgi:uncharacterized protein (TIGR02246 family)
VNVSHSTPADSEAVRALHEKLLDAWNRGSASGMAALFEDNGNVVGFDGSQLDGRAAIESEMGRIFEDHVTAAYVARIREIRFLTSGVAILRAVAGMIPPGQSDLNPAVNAVQTLVAVRSGEHWRIAVFQNTPAQFHGRPELVVQLTDELRQALHERTADSKSQE